MAWRRKIKIFKDNIIKGSKLNEENLNEIMVNLKEYKNKNIILKIFFQLFQIEDNKDNENITKTTNKFIYGRKREFRNDDESK